MMMSMGSRRKASKGGLNSNPMLQGCTQTCQAQLGCGELEAPAAGGGKKEEAKK